MPTTKSEAPPPDGSRRARLHQIVFEADTLAGRAFDVGLIALIIISIVAVSIESMRGLSPQTQSTMVVLEWVLTAVFTLEYVLRMIAVKRPLSYATSFSVWWTCSPSCLRGLASHPRGASVLVCGCSDCCAFFAFSSWRGSFRKRRCSPRTAGKFAQIAVFLLSVATIVVIVGSLMFVIEGPANGFTSIPRGMYWAIVTLTTVGYGDISPQTPLGQTLASFVMILGYGIIAVPTGIVTTELALGSFQHGVSTQACPSCSVGGHDIDAKYCRVCGARL